VPLKVGEIIKLIEADGWLLDRTRGSHRQYRHPVKPGTVTIAGETERHVASSHRGKHPEAGADRAEAVVTGYVVIIERDEAGGYSAWAPDLPGVVAAAASYDECLELMREAVELHIESLREHGDPIPAPAAVGAETIAAA
jgi:predicted RNase H-like HicB family nuclease/predicted RNA binding protein YcfA (HicA-like mRNA interferase family)